MASIQFIADTLNTAREYVYSHTAREINTRETEEEIALWAVEKVVEIFARELRRTYSGLDPQRFIDEASKSLDAAANAEIERSVAAGVPPF